MSIFKKIYSGNESFKYRKVENCEEVIHAAKALSGLTYEEIGKLCGVSKVTISERGSGLAPMPYEFLT